ncbi:MAG: ATP-binding protein [Deltaproteobacteria bacterium]|nr:MAG: ATP-binding protein [Deltaproteobacteria bacterium]
MSHDRNRHALALVKKLGSFWPVTGILGLRQVGKTTLLKKLAGIENFVSLDDEEVREEALHSSKNFLSKLKTPILIDEVQKAPALFDALKYRVDQKKIPGSYFLTGSSTFSSKLGIRESLTGRIGLLRLYPMTLSEIFQKKFEPERASLVHALPPRFSMDEVMGHLPEGGLPVPVFTRDLVHRDLYFKNWLETTVVRDVARVYGRGYDLDVSWSILRQLGKILQNGEWPTLRSFKQDSRVLRKYLSAFEDVFLVRKIPSHEEAKGGDAWIVTDPGIAKSIIGTEFGTGVTLSLARIFLMNEIAANFEYAGKPFHPIYYKSARGTPVEIVGNDIIIKITTETKGALSYEERSLSGAMKQLKLKRGFLVAPIDRFEKPGQGISLVPWSYWS